VTEDREFGLDDLTDPARFLLRVALLGGGSGQYVRTGMHAHLAAGENGGECDPTETRAQIVHLDAIGLVRYEDKSPDPQPPTLLDYTLTQRGRYFAERLAQIAVGAEARLSEDGKEVVRFLSQGPAPSGFLRLAGTGSPGTNITSVETDGHYAQFDFATFDALNEAGVILHMGASGYQLTEMGRAVAAIIAGRNRSDTRSPDGIGAAPPDRGLRLEVATALRAARDELVALERTESPIEAAILDGLTIPAITASLDALDALELGIQAWNAVRDRLVAGLERLRSARAILTFVRSRTLAGAGSIIAIVEMAIQVLQRL